MNAQHPFYLALAFGLSAGGLLLELLQLWRRCRRIERDVARTSSEKQP